MVYTDECLAVDVVREWLHSLPDSVDVERNEWDKYYIVSIPFTEEMAEMIKSSASDEEKVIFYKERIANLPKKEKFEFYLERTREIEEVYKEISAMFALEESNPSIVKQKTMEFIEKVALLKLTGKGLLDVVRFIERRLGQGSFKELAEKFGKFKEYEKSSNKFPFDINNLKDSDISSQHKKGKFFESDKLPNKVIRVENFEELLEKHGGKIEIPKLVEIAKKLYREFEDKYGISVPAEFFIGKNREGDDVVYSITDKINGKNFGEIENSNEIISKVEVLYTSVARYLLDKSKEGGLYLWDICGESQYNYGKKVGDEGDKIYLIDTDIWLNNSRTGMYLVVYWLTRHMSGAEMDFNTKFTEARDYIKQFISQPLPDNMSEDDMKNAEGIRSFLNNKKSDYNPESAIPNFE